MSTAFREKLASLQFAGHKAAPRVQVDQHDGHQVTVTTGDERQDVIVAMPPPVRIPIHKVMAHRRQEQP